jgi:perosamine synthetase
VISIVHGGNLQAPLNSEESATKAGSLDAPVVLPIARPVLGEAEAAAVGRVLSSGWVSQGPEVAAFEREFAAFTGAPFACAVSSCTAALHTALVALDIGPGDEVITVSHSFIATANAIRYVGALPVFVDVDPVNGNIDPTLIERAISPLTRALLVVHQVGMPCDLSAILAISQKHGLPLVEDAACAIGSEILSDGKWTRIGRPHGTVACFSFHPRKILTTGDGGMLTTADPALDSRFRLLRQHGMSVSDLARHTSGVVVAESYQCLGFNYRMTDVQAAIGRIQLQRISVMVRERRIQAERYRQFLQNIPGIGLPEEPAWARSNWQSYFIRLPKGAEQIAFMQAMLDRGISTRRGVMCSHREPAYTRGQNDATAFRAGSMCNSEYLQDHAVIIPIFSGLAGEDQQRVADTIRACLAASR